MEVGFQVAVKCPVEVVVHHAQQQTFIWQGGTIADRLWMAPVEWLQGWQAGQERGTSGGGPLGTSWGAHQHSTLNERTLLAVSTECVRVALLPESCKALMLSVSNGTPLVCLSYQQSKQLACWTTSRWLHLQLLLWKQLGRAKLLQAVSGCGFQGSAQRMHFTSAEALQGQSLLERPTRHWNQAWTQCI